MRGEFDMRKISDNGIDRMQVTSPKETASRMGAKSAVQGIPATEFIREAVNEKLSRSRIVDAGVEFVEEHSDVFERMAREE